MFLVMVSLHEFGHFIVAKMLNFKVDEFSVGMGPAIFKKKKGETQYSIRILPLGGYCKFEGEDEADNTDPRAFFQIKKHGKDCLCFWQVVFLISFWVLYCFLLSFRQRRLHEQMLLIRLFRHSYIEQVGVQPNDKIIKINGKKINFYNDISLYTQNFKRRTGNRNGF